MPETAGPENAARLLGGMHKVLSHDLPNQLVALHSLLHMLEAGEADRLSAAGGELVSRLRSAAGKASGMVRFLKEMARLNARPGTPAAVELDGLVRAVRVQLHPASPRPALDFDAGDAPAAVFADAALLQQGLV